MVDKYARVGVMRGSHTGRLLSRSVIKVGATAAATQRHQGEIKAAAGVRD